MQMGTILCLSFSCLFLFFTLLFGLWKEKASILISGFNAYTKEEQQQFDTRKLVQDHMHLYFTWTMLYVIGTILCHFISQYFAIPIFILWFILFVQNVHFDDEKAFGKYKK